MTAARFWAQMCAVPGGVAAGVVLDIDTAGRFSAVTAGVANPPTGAERLDGLTLPGFANAHSHAFHRALRGRSQGERGSFWTWRDQMYRLATLLDPDSYHHLARAVFAEMALAGVTCVGEFHYLHHGPDGVAYADPNEMGHRLIEAAGEAGIRITLLDTLYLSSTVDGDELVGAQRRFGDGDAARWADRVDRLRPPTHARVGVAAHSVRAVPAVQLRELATFAGDRPTHVHLSEQVDENDACLAAHGRTPARLIGDLGLAGPHVTAVHATHLTEEDVALLGRTRTGVCLCPTTERDLADGIGPARALADAGVPLSLGSDSHAVIDLFEEARAVELDERLRSRRRGHFTADDLLAAATSRGHAALGWPDAGTIEVGARADLVTVGLDSVRLAGLDVTDALPGGVFAATATDVRHVVVDGRVIVHNGVHQLVSDVPGQLHTAITRLWTAA